MSSSYNSSNDEAKNHAKKCQDFEKQCGEKDNECNHLKHVVE